MRSLLSSIQLLSCLPFTCSATIVWAERFTLQLAHFPNCDSSSSSLGTLTSTWHRSLCPLAWSSSSAECPFGWAGAVRPGWHWAWRQCSPWPPSRRHSTLTCLKYLNWPHLMFTYLSALRRFFFLSLSTPQLATTTSLERRGKRRKRCDNGGQLKCVLIEDTGLIDYWARRVFPASFILFVLVYSLVLYYIKLQNENATVQVKLI